MMYPEILDVKEYRHPIDNVWPPIHNVIKLRVKQMHINEFNPIGCSAWKQLHDSDEPDHWSGGSHYVQNPM